MTAKELTKDVVILEEKLFTVVYDRIVEARDKGHDGVRLTFRTRQEVKMVQERLGQEGYEVSTVKHEWEDFLPYYQLTVLWDY